MKENKHSIMEQAADRTGEQQWVTQHT